MSNTNRNPKELKGLIERSKSKEITIRAKSRDGFAIRSEIELLASQIDEQARLVAFYKNRGDDLVRKNQQLEKFSNALIEQRAFKFFRIDPNKVRAECEIMDHWSTHIAKTEYEIMRARIDEQTNLISYYKTRGDDYMKKILSVEKEGKDLMDEKECLQASYDLLNKNFANKTEELDEIIKGLNENCLNYKDEIEKTKADNEAKISELNQVNEININLIKKANEQAQAAMSKEITELNLSLKNQQADYDDLMLNLDAKKGEYLELNEQLRERNQELSLAKLEIEVNQKEIKRLSTEISTNNSEILRLKSEHYEKNNEINKMTDEITEKNSHIADLWSRINDKNQENSNANLELKEKNAELLRLKADLEDKTSQMYSLNLKLNEKNTVISELYSEIKEKNNKIEELNSNFFKKSGEHDDLKQALQLKVKECWEANAKISELEHQNSLVTKELTEKKLELSNLDEDLKRKSTQNTVLSMEKREKTMEVNKLNNEVSDKRNAIHDLNDEKTELDVKVKDMYILLKSNKDDYEKRIEYFQEEIKELIEEKNDYMGKCKKQNTENINLMDRCHKLNVKVKELTEKLEYFKNLLILYK